jgi:hypothetical protein
LVQHDAHTLDAEGRAMNVFTIDMLLLWVAVGGTLAVAAVADAIVLLDLTWRCWAMLMGDR